MAVRKKLESRVFDSGLPDTGPRGVYINREAVTAFAQYGTPAKIYPLFIAIVKCEKAFDLPDETPSLPPTEDGIQPSNLHDIFLWLDSIDCFEDALFAVQLSKTIFSRLPESYKKKASEVLDV